MKCPKCGEPHMMMLFVEHLDGSINYQCMNCNHRVKERKTCQKCYYMNESNTEIFNCYTDGCPVFKGHPYFE